MNEAETKAEKTLSKYETISFQMSQSIKSQSEFRCLPVSIAWNSFHSTFEWLPLNVQMAFGMFSLLGNIGLVLKPVRL